MNYEKFLKYSTPIFVAFGSFLLFGPKASFPSFYHPYFLGSIFLLSPFLAYLPEILIKKDFLPGDPSFIRIRASIILALWINNAGELGLYKLSERGFEYDKLAHFSVCMLFAYITAEYFLHQRHFSWDKTVFATLGVLFAAGIMWEAFEAFSDILFDAGEWGVYGKLIFPDTVRDLFFNSLGALAGLIVLSIPKQKKLSIKSSSLERVTGIGPVA